MNVPILDCHQHLVYPELFRYSWAEGIPALAGRAFRYDDYLAQVGGLGSVRTIFMETAPDTDHGHDESRFAMALADEAGSIIDGLILTCRPEAEEDFDRFVEANRHDKLVGFRRILHTMPDDLSQQPRFVRNVRTLAKHNLTFDLCLLPRQLPRGVELASTCPDVQFVLDHCGVPDIAGGDMHPWREHIRTIARCDNVACKISGVLAYCEPHHATVDAVRPYVEHCIECFGWSRVVWGSDWPVVGMTSTLATWIDVSRQLVAGESDDHQQQLFHRNAERIYLKQG